MYTGPYVPPRKQAAIPTAVDNHLDALKVGVFVAIALEKYKKVPVLGKVLWVNEDSFQIKYYKGTWRTSWCPWMISATETWKNVLPKTCILLVDFQLDSSNKLESETIKYLRDKYKSLKNK